MPLLEGYPTSIGSKQLSVATITGPASYTQYTAPSTGGQDVLVEPTFGVKIADQAWGGISADGTHEVKVVQREAGTVRGVTVANAQLVLKWYVLATDAEAGAAADLSGQTVALTVLAEK